MPPTFVRKKKKKQQEEDEEKVSKRIKPKKKRKKVTAPNLAIHPDVKKVLAIRTDKNKFVRELSTLLTERAGYPVRVIYQRSLDRKFNLKGLRDVNEPFSVMDNGLPFMRTVETDTPLGDKASFLFIVISDGAFTSEQLLGRLAQGMYGRW